MSNMPEENLNGGKERAPNSKIKQLWRSLIKRAPKERSPRQDPHPQVSGIPELPDNQQIPVPSHRLAPQELDPRRACSPPRAGPPRGSDQQPASSQHRPSSRRASRTLSGHNFPVSQEQGFIARPPVPFVDTTVYSSQLPRERAPRRARSQPNVKQPQGSNQPQESSRQRAAKRRSRINHSDSEITIAVMGARGKFQNQFKICID